METITLNQAAEILSDGSKPNAIIALQLLRAGYKVMHYYGEKVLAHKSQIASFCDEGIWECEGCERDRLLELSCQCEMPYFHIYDVPRNEAMDYIDFTDTIKTFADWMMEVA